MQIEVTEVRCKELQAGDLFSTAGPDYWGPGRDPLAVGEKVYIRTEGPCPKDQEEDLIFRVVVVK